MQYNERSKGRKTLFAEKLNLSLFRKMTPDQLFNEINGEIAFPHTTITKQNKKRAVETMRLFAEFVRHYEFFDPCAIARAIENKIEKIEEEMDIDNFLATQDACDNFVKDWEAIKV